MRVTKVYSSFSFTVEVKLPEGGSLYLKPTEGMEAELNPGEGEEVVRARLHARCRWHAYRHMAAMLKDADKIVLADDSTAVIEKVASSKMPELA